MCNLFKFAIFHYVIRKFQCIDSMRDHDAWIPILNLEYAG